MSLSMNYTDSDKLELFLGRLETDYKMAGEEIQKESAKIIKARVVGQLNRLRTKTKDANHKHMADDVSIRTVKDSFGDKVTKIQGGKKTGTLWHIVNDGNYNTGATHFMDKALQEAEQEIQAIIDAELSKVGD